MCIFCIHTPLKVVNHCDVSVLSMSDGFPKKLDRGVGGWVPGWGELYPIFVWIFLTLPNPLVLHAKNWNTYIYIYINFYFRHG